MKLLFPADPLNNRQVDPVYQAEATAAASLSIAYEAIPYETLLTNPDHAVSSIHANETVGLYRGWMLTAEQYSAFYEALARRGIELINNPLAYRHTHHLPESYPLIAQHSAKTIWVDTHTPLNTIMDRLRVFGETPLILKDYVKSQKHYWNEACYIPSAANQQAVDRVVRRFLELQGDELNGGLVFREYIPFEPLTTHSRSGMPLTKEYRLFWLDAELVYSTEYWEDADYGGATVPTDLFREVAKSIQSRFFTMDIAKSINGDWMIVELGDGQVAGLPDHADCMLFYQNLLHKLSL